MRKYTPIMNSKNLLAGITPAISGFAVNPGTIEDMVLERFDVELSQYAQTADANATIVYDLGRPIRFIGFTDNEFNDILLYGALDGITYHQLSVANCTQFAGVYRYIKITFGIHVQIRFIKNVLYEV